MIRHLLTAASVLALVSGAASAQTYSETYTTGPRTVTVAPAPEHTGEHRSITKRYINRHGMLVTKHKTFHDGFYGSSVERSKTVRDPMTGETRTRTEIER